MNATCQSKKPLVLEQAPDDGPVISYGGQPVVFVVWQLCGAPAIAEHRYRCEHGHERTGATCAEHQPVSGDVGCSQCVDQLGHDCPMLAEHLRDLVSLG